MAQPNPNAGWHDNPNDPRYTGGEDNRYDDGGDTGNGVVVGGGDSYVPPGQVGDAGDENPYIPDDSIDQYKYQTGVNGEKNYDINVGMTGGLMDTVSAIEGSKYANNGYGVRGGNATNRTVQDEERSQWQLQKMLASNSPLMQQAAAQGMARGGSRGLMNSSLSTGAAQGAMISGAQPFALNDADRYGTTAQDNMNATNSMAEANLNMRGRSMEAGARRDAEILREQLSGYGDIRKAMIGIEDREDTQAYNTSEREGSQDFTGDQNQLNRDWTSNENMLTNSLAWAQTKVDAATKMRMSREEAFTRLMSDIGGVENHKISATQRGNAIRDAKATLDAMYGEEAPGMYEMNYDPATGKSYNPETGEEVQGAVGHVPGTSTVVVGNTTITINPDGTYAMTVNTSDATVNSELNGMVDV
jgi:hypothetical protein